MPIRSEIDQTHRLVLTYAWGVVTAEDLATHRAQLLADPRFDPRFNQLMDMRQAKGVSVPSFDIVLAARNQIFEPGCRRAIVAADHAVFGMARMYQGYSAIEGQEIEVFRGQAEAMEWLKAAAV